MIRNISLAVISSRRELRRQVRDIIASLGSRSGFSLFFILNYAEAADMLNFEIPDMIIADFADPVLSPDKLLRDLEGEPWLNTAGIIGIVEDIKNGQLPSQVPQANVINVIDRRFIPIALPRILKILQRNRQILAQKGIIGSLISLHRGSFTIEAINEDFEGYINLLTNYLYQQGKISLNKSQGLALALYELVMNAVEHGSCQITYVEKSEHLAKSWDIMGLVRERLKDPKNARKKIILEYVFSDNESVFTITDEGQGFDAKTMLKKIESGQIWDTHGRGIYLAKQMVDSLEYNEKGNQATLTLKHKPIKLSKIPEGFINAETLELIADTTVFSIGEKGIYLYYIISGIFEVIVNNKVVNILTKDDLFFGEMSFLLNSPRSATIKARTQAKVLRINRQQFFQTVKQYPNYGLFLARLLAKRLALTTMKFINQKQETSA